MSTSKCSGHGVLCTFWLGNVLRTTMACTFSTSQFPKLLRAWGVLYILSWKCASHNGVQVFISHLASWLRLLFDPPEPQIIVNRDVSTFSRTCIFFLLTLFLLWSSPFFFSLLWLFPPLLFHLSISSEVWLLRSYPQQIEFLTNSHGHRCRRSGQWCPSSILTSQLNSPPGHPPSNKTGKKRIARQGGTAKQGRAWPIKANSWASQLGKAAGQLDQYCNWQTGQLIGCLTNPTMNSISGLVQRSKLKACIQRYTCGCGWFSDFTLKGGLLAAAPTKRSNWLNPPIIYLYIIILYRSFDS